jgi:hypothetical protein
LINSMQAQVEVDEPEPEAAPTHPAMRAADIFRPDDSETPIDRLTEEELLNGLARSIRDAEGR